MRYLVIALLLFGCSTVDWRKGVADSMTAVTTPVIVKTFQCTAEDAVKSDVQDKLYKWLKVNDVKDPKKKSIGSSICVAAVSAILPSLIDFGVGKLPAKWECTGENVNESVTSLAKTACALIP